MHFYFFKAVMRAVLLPPTGLMILAILGAALLALNPRAAGVGLNITAATHVVHYNLEWNPAVEDQASARAYRKGQDRPVTIHRLYYANTVEEAMNDRLTRKRARSPIKTRHAKRVSPTSSSELAVALGRGRRSRGGLRANRACARPSRAGGPCRRRRAGTAFLPPTVRSRRA